MTIPRVTFRRLLEQVGLATGLDDADGQLGPAFARRAARALTAATAYAWAAQPWDGTWVLFPGEEFDEDPTLAVEYCEPGSRLLKVFGEDPATAWAAGEDPQEIPWRRMESGTVALGEEADTPFYQVQTPAPVFGAIAAVSGTLYSFGDVVFDATTGDCFKLTSSAPAAGSTLNTPTGYTWVTGANYALNYILYYRGRTYISTTNQLAVVAASEPGIGSAWRSSWAAAPWQVQRLPHFLAEAVLTGAEQWLARTADGLVVTAQILGRAMDAQLETLVLNNLFDQSARRSSAGCR